MAKKRFELDLTKKTPRPIVVTDADSGTQFRFEFHKIFTRGERALLTRTMGKGPDERQVTDLRRLFRQGISSIQISDNDEDVTQAPKIEDPKTIVEAMDTPENMGGMPEKVTAQVVSYLLGENVLQEEQGNA